MSRHRIESLDDLRRLANDLAGEGGASLLLLLDGPMGAGKTQFTKFLLEALGSHETVSPSFAIHHSYETGRGLVHHFDLFRLENADDLESTGFWDLFDLEAWIVIEWAEKLNEFNLRSALPKRWPKVEMIFKTDPADAGARWVEVKRLS